MEVVFDAVSKSYGAKQAIQDLSITFRPGIVGLLGPNGAGKTTMMSMMATLQRPSAGKVLWNGVDIHRFPEQVRATLGYLPQQFGIYPHLTADEFLAYLAAAKGLTGKAARSRITHLLEALNLTDVTRRRLGTLSGGMRQRVGIAQALLNDPQILIVDEPTVGLDPEERMRFRHLLSELPGERLVILSTHIVSDVESIAGELAIIRGGRLIIHSTADELVASVSRRVWELEIGQDEVTAYRQRYPMRALVRRGDRVRLRILADESPAPDAESVPPTLEDAYLYWALSG